MLLQIYNNFYGITDEKYVNDFYGTTEALKYKRKGQTLAEVIFVLVIILITAAVAFVKWPDIRDFARSVSERRELQNMATAASTYASLKLDGANPTSAADLINGLEATDSIDGVKHAGLMSGKSDRWANGSYLDAWGQEFTFGKDSDGNSYITSNGPDQQYGTDDDITVYY